MRKARDENDKVDAAIEFALTTADHLLMALLAKMERRDEFDAPAKATAYSCGLKVSLNLVEAVWRSASAEGLQWPRAASCRQSHGRRTFQEPHRFRCVCRDDQAPRFRRSPSQCGLSLHFDNVKQPTPWSADRDQLRAGGSMVLVHGISRERALRHIAGPDVAQGITAPLRVASVHHAVVTPDQINPTA